MRESTEKAEAVLGEIVLYHAKDGDDVAELVPFPLCPDMETFAAIVTRSHARGTVDLMILDPSRGPMPRWKVPFSAEARPGHWTSRAGGGDDAWSAPARPRSA
ncbi:MAG TPA: hypothetical protein VMR21_00110 [Vicinamibacteria bacterium]|nr:hypothetical protein [Vicinamibacteria bacterium]